MQARKALLIDTAGPTAGDATVIGNSPTNHLYFLTTTGISPTTLQPNTPLSWGSSTDPAIQVHRVTVGDNFQAVFDQTTQTWTWQPITTGESTLSGDYTLWVTSGTVNTSEPNDAIY